jgi:PKD repeat protein
MIPRRFGYGLVAILSLALVLSALGSGALLSPPNSPRTAVEATPAATFSLTAPGLTPTDVSLSWTQTGDVTASYTVYDSAVGATGPWQTATTITSYTTTTYTGAGFAPSTSYWWMVTESGLFGTSSSNVLEVTQPATAYLSYTLLSATDLQFTWTNNATYGGALAFQSYALLESAGGHPATTVQTITAVGTKTTSVSSLSPGSGYTFYLNTTDCYAGCGSGTSSLSVSESTAVTYGAPLPLAASVSAVRPAVDLGESDTFTCTASGGQSPYSFAWNFGNGSYVPGNASMNWAFSTLGPTTVMCQVTDNQSTSIMAGTSIVVATDPTASASANRTAADVGQSIGFNCSASGGFPPYTYSWTFGDGSSASTAEPSHVYASAGTRVAACTVTDASFTAATKTVSVGLSPTLGVTASASSPAAAPGTTLTFTAAPFNGSGSYTTITWTFGDGTSASGPNIKHLYSAVGNYTVTASVSDTNGGQAAAQVAVEVSSLVVVLGTVPTSSASTHQVLSFSASASGGAGGPYNYTWSFGDGSTGYGASVSHQFTTAGTFHVTLQVSDKLGATHLSTLNAITVTAPATPAPLVTAPLLLLIAAILGLLAFLVGVVIRRRRREQEFSALAGRVPVTGPAGTVKGSKVCRVCGASNVPVRKTCEACGASLRGPLLR